VSLPIEIPSTGVLTIYTYAYCINYFYIDKDYLYMQGSMMLIELKNQLET